METNNVSNKKDLAYLTTCADCGGDLDTYHRDYVSDSEMEAYLRCLDCGTEYLERWVLTEVIREKKLETA